MFKTKLYIYSKVIKCKWVSKASCVFVSNFAIGFCLDFQITFIVIKKLFFVILVKFVSEQNGLFVFAIPVYWEFVLKSGRSFFIF